MTLRQHFYNKNFLNNSLKNVSNKLLKLLYLERHQVMILKRERKEKQISQEGWTSGHRKGKESDIKRMVMKRK